MKDKYYHIYATTTCPHCVRAINLLNESEYEYLLTLIDNSPSFFDVIKEKYSWKTIPIIFECYNDDKEEKMIGGCSDLMDYFLTPQEESLEDPTETTE